MDTYLNCRNVSFSPVYTQEGIFHLNYGIYRDHNHLWSTYDHILRTQQRIKPRNTKKKTQIHKHRDKSLYTHPTHPKSHLHTNPIHRFQLYRNTTSNPLHTFRETSCYLTPSQRFIGINGITYDITSTHRFISSIYLCINKPHMTFTSNTIFNHTYHLWKSCGIT